MSEKGSEQATPQRKQKAKEKGDLPRSRELVSAVAMLSGLIVAGGATGAFASAWGGVYRRSLGAALTLDLSDRGWSEALRWMVAPAVLPVGAILMASFGGALFAGMAQGGGVSMRVEAIAPKLSRLNPIANLGQLFSLRSTVRVMKSLVPAGVMAALGWAALKKLMVASPVMSLVRLPASFSAGYGLALDAAWVTLAWSALDYLMERRSWAQRLKMSKQDIRDEAKEAMGNPLVKMKIRQIQRAMRKRKVKADISRASVVITNPTHYAVALEFSFETMQAPSVLAKGRDLHALEIRDEARRAEIPIIENPPLARSLYKMVEAGQSIPFELYAAVAGILAFLYRQKVEARMREERERNTPRAYAPPRSASSSVVLEMEGGM